MSEEKNTLPTLAEIERGEMSVPGKLNALNILLNQEPPKAWLKKQNGVMHLPVDKVKFLLTKIFVEWYETINQVQIVANSVVVIITLHYKNPITNEWCKMDGIGATPINTVKGASAMDWGQVVHDSVHKCTPAADAYALKNAAKKIGRIFGGDYGKDDLLDFGVLQDSDRFANAKAREV
jgi:hypothetical protein